MQSERRKCHERQTQLSQNTGDIHQDHQGRASEKKRIQQHLHQIRAVATKRIQVSTLVAQLMGEASGPNPPLPPSVLSDCFTRSILPP